MNILITGGAGFVGRHVSEFLSSEHNITIFDNFSNSSKNSIIQLSKKGIKIVEGDILNNKEINENTKDQEIIIHLAAKISVEDSIKNPFETLEVNVLGTKNVLNACLKNNVKKIIIASSSAVYGEGLPGIKLKEDSKKNPISPYGESKLVMEQEIAKFLSHHSNVECTILRFFNIFGIGQSNEYSGVITKFLEKISKNESLEIFGDGEQTRDFISIEDVVKSIFNALENKKSGTYNIASGKTTTINHLAKLLISFSKKEIQVNYLPPKIGDIKFSQADISLARKEINFSPQLKIESIKKMILN